MTPFLRAPLCLRFRHLCRTSPEEELGARGFRRPARGRDGAQTTVKLGPPGPDNTIFYRLPLPSDLDEMLSPTGGRCPPG